MAKVLKFGLMLDDCNVRSLEGLQEHFVIEDVLKYFEDGTLSRWLRVWGYKEQLAAVEAINKALALDKKDIVLQLANIFGIEDVDAADIEKALSVFSYLDKKQKFQVTVQENALFKKQAVEEYLADYEALIQHMIDNSGGNIVEKLNKVYDEYDLGNCNEEQKTAMHPFLHVNTDININVGALKEDIQKLEQDYLQLVKLSFSDLYFRLVEIAPMAIVAMLWSDTFRELLIGKNANVYLKNSFYRGNIPVDKKYPVLLHTIEKDSSDEFFWYYIFKKFSNKWAVPNIDGLKIMFFDLKKGKKKEIVKAGNKVIVLLIGYVSYCRPSSSFLSSIPSSSSFMSSLVSSSSFSSKVFYCYGYTSYPYLSDGLVVQGDTEKYRQFVIYMSV